MADQDIGGNKIDRDFIGPGRIGGDLFADNLDCSIAAARVGVIIYRHGGGYPKSIGAVIGDRVVGDFRKPLGICAKDRIGAAV